MPNLATLHAIIDAFRWLEEHYASIECEPRGMWSVSVYDDRISSKPVEAVAEGFLPAYDRLRGKLAGTIPLDDSDLRIMEEIG